MVMAKDEVIADLRKANVKFRVSKHRLTNKVEEQQAAMLLYHDEVQDRDKEIRETRQAHHIEMEEAAVRYELEAGALQEEINMFELQLKDSTAVQFMKCGSSGRFNNFFFDTARRFLTLGLSPAMVHKVMQASMDAFGLKADRIGSVHTIKKARDQLGVLLLSHVGHRVDAAIEAGASIQLMQDATSLLHRDGMSLMAVKLRITWPDHSGKLPTTETLTAGVKEARSGSADHEKAAIIEISEDIADMMLPLDEGGDHQLDRRRFALAPNTRISDTAATAIKVNAMLAEERREWLLKTAPYQAAGPAKRARMLMDVDIDCVSHGVQNSGLVIPKAMDAAAAAMVGYALFVN
jgi:hypothetical protein